MLHKIIVQEMLSYKIIQHNKGYIDREIGNYAPVHYKYINIHFIIVICKYM